MDRINDAHSSPAPTPSKRRRPVDLDSPDSSLYPEGGPIANACNRCRSRKIRCDARRPTCENCERSSNDCAYPFKRKPGQRSGKESGTTRRIKQLEDHCRRYEKLFADLETRFGLEPMRSSAAAHDAEEYREDRVFGGSTGRRAGPVDGHVEGDDYASGMVGPAWFDGTYPPGGQQQIAPVLDLGSFMNQSPEVVRTAPAPVSAPVPALPMLDPIPSPVGSVPPGPSFSWSPMSFLDPDILPSSDIVIDLIDLYWKHVHPWAPILGPAHISPAQIRLARSDPRAHPNHYDSSCRITLDPPWDIVVHAIVVVALRFSDDPRLQGKKDKYRTSAKQHIIAHAIESTSISSLQALVLLAIDLVGSHQSPSSWGTLALLTRSVVHIGLSSEDRASVDGHTGPPPLVPSLSRTNIIGPPVDWHEDEARRRLFWLIYVLDRCACVSTGWDFSFSVYDVRRRLPCSDLHWTKTEKQWFASPYFLAIPHLTAPHADAENLNPMAYLIEVADMLGRTQMLQSQTIDPSDPRGVDVRRDASRTLMTAAERWIVGMPLRNQTSATSLLVRALHHANVIKLSAFYAFPALSNGDPVEPFSSTCLASAHEIAMVCLPGDDDDLIRSTCPLAAWAYWSAARVLFIHAYLNRQHVSRDFDTIVSGLKKQAVYWTVAHQYVELLERAQRNWLASLSVGAPALAQTTDPSLSDSIRDLIDLRKTAYSAVASQPNVPSGPYAAGEAGPFASGSGPNAGTGFGFPEAGRGETLPVSVNPGLFERSMEHLPVWAVQPVLGDLHSWFDLPAGVFGDITR